MRAIRPSRDRNAIANDLGDVANLLPDEQSELALKIRYGIGLGQLTGSKEVPAMPNRPRATPAAPREPDACTNARAAALGLGAGRRGQWLKR